MKNALVHNRCGQPIYLIKGPVTPDINFRQLHPINHSWPKPRADAVADCPVCGHRLSTGMSVVQMDVIPVRQASTA